MHEMSQNVFVCNSLILNDLDSFRNEIDYSPDFRVCALHILIMADPIIIKLTEN